MRIRIVFIALSLLYSLFALGQKKMPGYYINLQGEKIEVEIEAYFKWGAPIISSARTVFTYFDTTQTKFELHPNMCKEVTIQYPDTMISYVSIPNYFFHTRSYRDNDSIFIRPVTLGVVNLYHYDYSTQITSPTGGASLRTDMFELNGLIIERYSGKHYVEIKGDIKKEDLAAFFSDSAIIANEVLKRKKRRLGYEEVIYFVEKYNKLKNSDLD